MAIFNCRSNNIYTQPIVGEYIGPSGKVSHGNEEWFRNKNVELLSFSLGVEHIDIDDDMLYLTYKVCQAGSDNSVTITPQGWLVKCPEQFGVNQVIGNVREGVINHDLVQEWKRFGDYEKCRVCVFFPFCSKVKGCLAKDRCTIVSALLLENRNAIIQRYELYQNSR